MSSIWHFLTGIKHTEKYQVLGFHPSWAKRSSRNLRYGGTYYMDNHRECMMVSLDSAKTRGRPTGCSDVTFDFEREERRQKLRLSAHANAVHRTFGVRFFFANSPRTWCWPGIGWGGITRDELNLIHQRSFNIGVIMHCAGCNEL